MNPTVSDIPLMSLYTKRGDKSGVDITYTDFLDGIEHGPDWEKLVGAIREKLTQTTDKDERSTIKGTLPCVTVSGRFKGDKAATSLVDTSGYIAVDFDHLSDVEQVRAVLNLDPYTAASFLSCSATGFCVLVKVQPERFLDAFYALEAYYLNTYGYIIDVQCKNINRLRYISSDARLFRSEKAKLWKTYLTKAETKRYTAKAPAAIHCESNIDYVIGQIESRYLDITPGYYEWHRIGFAFVGEFGESGRSYFHRVSQFHSDYNPEKCDRLYSQLMRYGSRQITIATFYYYAKLAGCEVVAPKIKEVVSAASLHKKMASDVKSTIEYLKFRGGATDEEAKEVIDQVFNSPDDFSSDETLFDQLESFVRAKHDLQRNEITRYIEDGGAPMLDEDINSLYIAAAKTFEMKVSKPMVEALLHSRFVANYHPIKEFLRRNSYRRPVGVIDSLADCIKHDMGKVGKVTNYVHFFLRKWLIGFISSAHGEQSPLVLVLTGEGNTGKTQFFRRLLPPELRNYYGETKFDKGTDDEILMCKKLLLMNDEFGGNTVKESKKFKDLTDKVIFTVRRPYGKTHEDLPRLAILAGTSNDQHILNDPTTKNRRIIPVNVISIDHTAYNQIDKIDLLMEAYHAYIDGERADLTNEHIEWLYGMTTRFEDRSLEHDLAERYFSLPTNKEDASLLSQGEIMVYLSQVTGIKNLKPKVLSQEMKAMGFPYSDGEYYKPEGKTKRGFYVYKRNLTDSPPSHSSAHF